MYRPRYRPRERCESIIKIIKSIRYTLTGGVHMLVYCVYSQQLQLPMSFTVGRGFTSRDRVSLHCEFLSGVYVEEI